MSLKTPQVAAFWAAYRAAAGLDHDRYDVVAFGDSPQMADELGNLVLHGPKRATAGLLRDFGPGGEIMPAVGEHVVMIDGSGAPRCIWRTTDVQVKPLIEVDDAFAWDEGEGDRTRDDWLRAHRKFFARQAARGNFAFHDRIETVFERFTIVWPPEVADP
ncbi:MAG TPA: ASCH domain-containing protein [Dongiaceae bacterium]